MLISCTKSDGEILNSMAHRFGCELHTLVNVKCKQLTHPFLACR